MDKVNIAAKFAQFGDHWSPKVVGDLNGQQVKLVKFQGEFVWHHHEAEDELFLVVRGAFRMEFRDRSVDLHAGEFLIVPRGVEHRPVADEEVEVMLFEPAATLNTGMIRALLAIRLFPPVAVRIWSRRNGVTALPRIPAASAAFRACSSAASIRSGSMARSAANC